MYVDVQDVQAEHELQALQLGKVAAQSEHTVVDDEQYPELHTAHVVAFGHEAQFVTVHAAFVNMTKCPKQMRISMIRVSLNI